MRERSGISGKHAEANRGTGIDFDSVMQEKSNEHWFGVFGKLIIISHSLLHRSITKPPPRSTERSKREERKIP